jgi:lipid-binding SYLF domain-containing protein
MMIAKVVTQLLVVALLLGGAPTPRALAASDEYAELKQQAAAALQQLYASNEAARVLRKKAKAVLVFPRIVKAGFLIGGQIGDGVLLKNGRPSGVYNSVAGSYGLQAGGQVFSYALFFMSNDALKYLDSSDGWEVGVGPSVVVVDSGMGKSITSTTVTQDVYAFIFSQKGLMGGLGVQGSKITRIDD